MERFKLKVEKQVEENSKVLEIDISDASDSIEIVNNVLNVQDIKLWTLLGNMKYFSSTRLTKLMVRSPYTADFEFSDEGNKLLVVYEDINNTYYSLEKQ